VKFLCPALENALTLFPRWSIALVFALGIAGMAGCAHPCGYIDIRTVMTPLESPEHVTQRLPDPPFRVVEEISPENGVLRVRAETIERHSKLFRRDVYGKKVYAPYAWYTPIVKPVVAITVVGPLYFSIRAPHSHAGYPWRRRDYFRDVVAWFNILSGVPVGTREFEDRDVLVRWDVTSWTYRDVPVPAPDRRATLRMEGWDLAEVRSDADGMLSLDIVPYLAKATGEQDVYLELVTPGPGGEEAVLHYTIPAETVRRLKDEAKPPDTDSGR
jgi:hypothetical protein